MTGELVLQRFTAEGFPPLGRHSLTMEAAERLLVAHKAFKESTTRADLWDGLVRYLDNFLTLDDVYAADLEGLSLIHSVWLGGSFVSTKANPGNIDAAVLVDSRAERIVRGNPGSKWLTEAFKSRDHIRRNFGVSPLKVGYRPVASVFELRDMPPDDQRYFTERGIWDDWWQRCRRPDQTDRTPSEASAVPTRGYLEVRL